MPYPSWLRYAMLRRAEVRAKKIKWYYTIRRYSKDSKLINERSDKEFYEWFVGFCDAESKFKIYIRKDKRKGINFAFKIELHIDDLKVLHFIKNKLNCGKVNLSNTRNSASYSITGTKDLITTLIPIFDEFTLNTTKYLDFLCFKEIISLYLTKKHLNDEGMNHIKDLLNNFNKKRTNFTLPQNHQINITSYWLLGFLEGESSFSIGRAKLKNSPHKIKFNAQFTISLTEVQKPVLEAIKIFINNLGINKLSPNLYIDRCGINNRKAQSSTAKPQYALVISDTYFIYNFFIPFLNNLHFCSNKKLDFNNWKLGVDVLVKGLHLLEEGQIYLQELMSRMNWGRLSSNYSKIKTKTMPAINIFSYNPLYEFGTSGEIIEIASKKTITVAKFYLLTPLPKLTTLAPKSVNFCEAGPLNKENITKPLYLKGKAELCEFFSLSDTAIYKAINNKKSLFSKKTNLEYIITKIF